MNNRGTSKIFADAGPQKQEQGSLSFERPAISESKRGDIMVRLPYEARRELRQLALDHETSVQKLMEEAINLVMIHYHRDPVA